jgi:glycosyltransferase involved in cell wall biosynthesis
MKILQINQSDVSGGAARAAHRLHTGLLRVGALSQMIVSKKLTEDRDVVLVEGARRRKDRRCKLFKAGVQGFIDNHRTSISNTLFSFNYPGLDISAVPQVLAADIINLHWVANSYQSPVTLSRLFALGKPVVWTLHDQWPFTGGCHYSAGCANYRVSCSPCPQLTDDLDDLPSKILMDKVELFRKADLTIVSPSRWLKELAEKSRLFGDLRIEVIPNSLETEIFTPVSKKKAKELFGISPDVRTLLFGGGEANERRKGYDELLGAIGYCCLNPKFKALLSAKKIMLLVFGHPGDELNRTGIPVRSFGYIKSDEMLRDIYSAADFFVLPSLEDNLPNTMLEAMSCGTPVVSFEVGGMPDLISDGTTGKLAAAGDVRALGNAIIGLLSNRNASEEMGKRCRTLIETGYAVDIQANRYLELYDSLSRKRTAGGFSTGAHTYDAKSFSSRYVVPTETATGNNFMEIEETVKNKVWNTMMLLKLKEVRNTCKRAWESICFSNSDTQGERH